MRVAGAALQARRAWALLAAGLALGALAAAGLVAWGDSAESARWRLDWQPALALSQPWRLFTAAWVHWSTWHLAANLAGLALIGALGWRAGCGTRAALAWGLAWPLTHLALLLQPGLAHYGGLSGVLHAGAAVAGWQLLVVRPHIGTVGRQRRWVGGLLLLGLAVKLLLEQPWGEPLRRWPGWDIAIAPLAHATGAVAGLLCAWITSRGGRR
ncbi:MAG: rhombosortase [Aquabacterium sp.]